MWGRIDSTTIINGHLCYVYNYDLNNDSLGTNYSFEENGYIRLYADWHINLGFILLDSISSYTVKQFPQIDDSWLGGGYEYPIKYTVISTETITVPAGSFFTFKVEGRDTINGNLKSIGYWADSVGLVRSINYKDNFEANLASYSTQGNGCYPLIVGNEWLYNIWPVSVDAHTNDIPKNFNLWDTYPNPFNPSTKIRYSVPQSSNVVIKVFDILGNEIETLVDEEKTTGTYELTWYAESLPSGVYCYRLQAGSFVETKKMVLLR